MVLTLLALLVAALVVTAAFSVFAAFAVWPAIRWVCVALCSAAALLALTVPFGLAAPARFMLPLGPPGGAFHLALDPLGSCVLLLLMITALPGLLFGSPTTQASRGRMAANIGLLAALTVVALADDGGVLLLALILVGFCIVIADAPAGVGLCAIGFVVLCLAVALVLGYPGSPPFPAATFAELRAAPPEGWRGDIELLLVLAGALPLLLAPPSIMRLCRPAPDMAPLLVVGLPITGLYLLLRLIFDLCGSVQPAWWSMPLLVCGVACVVVGSLRAALAAEFGSVVVFATLQQTGLALLALGLALAARAADQPSLANQALGAAWLAMISLSLGATPILLAGGAVQSATGTRQLDRMGGLIHRMPKTALAVLAGFCAIVALPPGFGFATAWLVFQSLVGASRIGGIAWQLLLIGTTGIIAVAAAVAVLAAVRLFGVAFLGRPRTPRCAVADEITPGRYRTLLAATGLIALLGVLPGLALAPARAALASFANAADVLVDIPWMLSVGSEMPGYAPLPLAMVLGLTGAVVIWLVRRFASTAARRESAWCGGFAPPPPWLPFGDPAMQASATAFSAPFRRLVDAMRAARPRRLPELLGLLSLKAAPPILAWLAVVVLILAAWLVIA